MKPVHYDVETLISDLERSNAELNAQVLAAATDSQRPYLQLQIELQPIIATIARTHLNALNAGVDEMTIAEAIGHGVGTALWNWKNQVGTTAFVGMITTMINDINGVPTPGMATGAAVRPSRTQGGHA